MKDKQKPKKEYLCFCSQCEKAFYAAHPDTLFCSEYCLKKYGGVYMVRHVVNLEPNEKKDMPKQAKRGRKKDELD